MVWCEYGFRGVSHENIMNFPRWFSGHAVVKLEENYRSTQSILDAASAVLSTMENKYGKTLVSAGGRGGDRPRLLTFVNPYEEARRLADLMAHFSARGISPTKQAALFRSAYVSIPLQTELTKRGVRFQVFGGLKFYETAHVKDVLACVRAAVNRRDELAWQRALMMIEGVGVKASDAILNAVFAAGPDGSLERRVRAAASGKRWSAGIGRFTGFLGQARGPARPADIFRMAVHYYTPIMREKFDDWRERAGDLKAVLELAEQYEDMGDLLADLTVDAARGGAEERGGFTLSTIHSAKGLEWEAVFLLGASVGVLPSRFTFGDGEALEEELRLFYVAITRAREFLILSHAGDGELSRFLLQGGVIDCFDCGEANLNRREGDDWEGNLAGPSSRRIFQW